MKIGDMVKWTPVSLNHDEGIGLVLDINTGNEGEAEWILIWFADETKPRWRAHTNLEVISEGR